MKRTGRWGRRAAILVAGALLAGCAAGADEAPTARSAAPVSAPTAAPPERTGRTGPTTTVQRTTTGAPDTADTADDLPGQAGEATDPDGIGDELFPALGNPGLDVQHYDIDLRYDHAAQTVEATVGLDVRMTEDRDEITLDAAGPVVEAVVVDGAAATFAADGVELRITPAAPLRAGDDHRIEVAYHFTGDSTIRTTGIEAGWFNTAGGSYVLNEPDAARTWLPSNDHPSDKATFDITIHVAPGVTGVANGALVEHTSTDEGETWHWRQDEPMATYLLQLLTGDYELVEGTGPDDLPLLSAVLRSELPRMQPILDDIDDEIAFFETQFGPYPLDRYGIAVTDSFGGLAMETQGRSQFSKDDLGMNPVADATLTSHELAHQWFGDAVTPERWQDIWLNEGFATYGEWLWAEHTGGPPPRQQAETALRYGYTTGPLDDPEMFEMFGISMYQGGGAALEALRATIGDDAFFELLRKWVADNDGTSRTIDDFVALAERVSGVDLDAFADDWLRADTLPSELPPADASTPSSTPTAVTSTTRG